MSRLLGAHMSIEGGFHKALLRGKGIGCDIIQVFTKNTNQWRVRELKEDEVQRFKRVKEETGISIVIAHDSYLINLASPDEDLWKKSLDVLLIEMERAEALGIAYLVIHPGSHNDAGEEWGIKRIVRSLDLIHTRARGFKTSILLETTAGQGTSLCYKFEHIREILYKVREPERLGVCLDTCHVFAAGYDIRDEFSYEKTMKELDRLIGIRLVKVIHLNDSKRELGSRVDRHEHIGRGFIGIEGFRFLLRDGRFTKIPMVIETPKGEDMREDIENLKTLRSLTSEPYGEER